jgi:hypothetical protein
MNNLDKFMEVYTRHLKLAVESHPEEYVYSMDELFVVLARMRNAFAHKSFNKDSRAIKATCKELKIKHTYRDIETFLGHTEVAQ